MVEIEFRNLTKTRINEKLLRKIAEDVLRKAEIQKPSSFAKELGFSGLSVVFVGPKRAQELNKIYRRKEYIPNILTFDYGEIVLCPFAIRRDAKKYGTLFEQELSRVFAHGVLHLIGYSHTQMEKIS